MSLSDKFSLVRRSKTAIKTLRRFRSNPLAVLLGYPKLLELTSAWISTKIGRLPSSVARITEPSVFSRSSSSAALGFSTIRRPLLSISNIAASLVLPYLYTEDVYAVDPNTGAKFTIDANGNIQYTILHHKGDQVYDPNGVALMLHYKGDYMLDPQTNKPLIKFPMKIGRELDLFLIEGSYWFATDTAATGYRELLTASVVDWLVSDIETIQEELLEETYIYFYPKQSIGLVSVLTGDGVTTNIDALQSIVVNLYVPNSVYTNTDLRNTLEKNTITIIDTALQNTIISKNEIQNNLASSYGSDVTDVELSGLGGSLNLSVLTMTKDSDRLALRKILKLQSDNTLIVAEDVTINFIRHDLVSLTAAQLNIT